MRSQLMGELRIKIRDKQWTQAEAAKVLGILQSRVSDLIRGKWDKFSLDMLITGDRTHFGPLYGKSIQSVTVLSPAMLAETVLA